MEDREQDKLRSLNRELDFIGVDIDGWNTYALLKSYIKARILFPNAKIKTSISKSGSGFHIEIHQRHTLLDNILYRCVLDDDIVRIKLSLSKLFMSNGEEKNFDLLFNENEIEFNIEEILGVDIEKLIEDYDDSLVVEMAEKLSKALEKYRKEKWVVYINFGDVNNEQEAEALKEKIKQVCEDITAKDDTFKWRIRYSSFENKKYCLRIFCNSKDEAHKKGTWFVKKVFDDKELYFVKKE